MNLFLGTQLLFGVIILRPVSAVRNTEDHDHKQYGQTDHPPVVFPLQCGKGNHEEHKGDQRLIICQVCSEGESRPPRTECHMLYERT